MRSFTFTTEVDRPVGDVFAYLTDPQRLHEWQENTLEVHLDGPMRTGSRMKEVRKGPGGKRVESTVEVAAYEPDRVFDLRIVEGPVHVHGDHRLEPSDGGTLIHLTGHGELKGAAKLLRPLLPRLFKRSFAKLKQNLEGSPRP
jgi:uncharacterized protein YndB with AHSA1/START domain